MSHIMTVFLVSAPGLLAMTLFRLRLREYGGPSVGDAARTRELIFVKPKAPHLGMPVQTACPLLSHTPRLWLVASAS